MTTTALTRAVSASLADAEVTYIERGRIDVDAARRQHAGYVAALEGLGWAVEVLPPLDGRPDAVFVEDPVVVLDDVAILLPMGAATRRGEAAALAPAIARYRETVSLGAPGSLEGGDVLRIGRRLYVGLGSRTDAAGVERLREIAEPRGYGVVPVELGDCLHLKTACSWTGRHLLINPAWIDEAAFGDVARVRVPAGEPWSANVIAAGDRVLCSATHPAMARRLAELGYAPVPVELSEFEKAEAGVTCLSVVVG